MPVRLDNALVGAAGVHFVASELSLRGLIALPTIRNAQGIDLLVVAPAKDWHASLQVKTSRYKAAYWLIGEKYESVKGANLFYVFVRYLPKESHFEAFLEPSDGVINAARLEVEESRRCGKKAFTPWWSLPTASTELERARTQWREFGRAYPESPR